MVLSQRGDRVPSSGGGIVNRLIMHTPGMIMTNDTREHNKYQNNKEIQGRKRGDDAFCCHLRTHRRILTMRLTTSKQQAACVS